MVLAVQLEAIMSGEIVWVMVCVILAVLCFPCVIVIWRQPESKEALTFKVPDVQIIIDSGFILCCKSSGSAAG